MQQMLDDIAAEVEYTAKAIGRSRLSERVMNAIRNVPRHSFVPDSEQADAYENRPLPIGYGQTISQPYIVAVMTELLEPRPHHRILEIGCGSGYQAAVLSLLVKKIISLEIIPSLAGSARQRLSQLGYSNVEVINADGHFGCKSYAPYDGIIVTAAPENVPQSLIDQLTPTGHLVIPVGVHHLTQQLLDIQKATDGSLTSQALLPVSFVPFTTET